MKILVRTFDNDGTCNYVWKKMKSENPFQYGTYHTDDGCAYSLTSILKVTHDYRKSDYVQCGVCGKVVKRDKIDKHYEEREREADCMKCGWLELLGRQNSGPINVMRKDGFVVSKNIFVPYCSKGRWRGSTRLSEINKVADCKYYACRRGSTKNLHSDFLSQNPNPYRDLLTENAVIENGWHYMGSSQQGRNYSFDTKLIARFDSNGILIGFNFFHRNNTYNLVYSDVYDKIIWDSGEFDWEGIADRTREKYTKQIRKLYN